MNYKKVFFTDLHDTKSELCYVYVYIQNCFCPHTDLSRIILHFYCIPTLIISEKYHNHLNYI